MDLELEEKWEDNIGSLKKKLSAVGLNIVSQEKNVVRVAVEKNLWKMSDILRFVRQLQDNGIILGYRNNEVKLVDVYLKVT